ncbi:MAG TPA: ribosome maturation factor RimM [Thermoanaerobaculia bacterium]|jgi:16S rRNA processing protein RimM
MSRPELLAVARLHRPHGLRGEVSAEVLTAFPERLRPGLELIWQRGEETRSVRLSDARAHGARMLLRFEGVEDADAARALAGGDLCVAAGDAVPAPEGFFYSHELLGFACRDREGRALGTAAGVEETPAGPLLSVTRPDGKEALVPFVAEYVVDVDRDARAIILDLPAGLLEL